MSYQGKSYGLHLKTFKNLKTYKLKEKGKDVKEFTQEEVNQILDGSLDYTKFFKEEDSLEKLQKALKGREMTIGFTEPKDF